MFEVTRAPFMFRPINIALKDANTADSVLRGLWCAANHSSDAEARSVCRALAVALANVRKEV